MLKVDDRLAEPEGMTVIDPLQPFATIRGAGKRLELQQDTSLRAANSAMVLHSGAS